MARILIDKIIRDSIMTRTTVIHTYNGDGHSEPLLKASIEMLRSEQLQKLVGPIDVRNTPGRNYEGAPSGYIFVGGGNAFTMSLKADDNAAFWQMTRDSSEGYVGICAGSVLTCPVQRYEFSALQLPNKINTPIEFKGVHSLVDSAISLVPGVLGKLNYTSVGYEAEQLIIQRDRYVVTCDNNQLQKLEAQYRQSFATARSKRKPIFDALKILDCQGGLAHQVGLDSLIFDVSGAYGVGMKTIAAVAQESLSVATGSIKLDTRHAFAFVSEREGKFCIGGHPEAAFQFKPLYDHFCRDGFVPSCGAGALIADLDDKKTMNKASQKQSIIMLSEGLSTLFHRKNPAQEQVKPAVASTMEHCGGAAKP
jgi:hypothetical protein